MNKIYMKLVAMALALVLSVSVAAMASYAWLVLAQNPVATGIQVAIGGGNTILTAPDITKKVDGEVIHYPGRFSSTMNFGREESYEYLKTLGNLTPVSTYNGIDWFLPAYYTANDKEVRDGRIPSGQLKSIQEFTIDGELQHANLPATETELIEKGNYLYLDFWVVAPGGDYTLRLSTPTQPGDDSGGSFVVDLLEPQRSAESYELVYPKGTASASVRVGFLANPYTITDQTMEHYINSGYYNEAYTSLRGLYLEPNSGTVYFEGDRFTIYEPNADSHPGNTALEGQYVMTNPIALVNGTITDDPDVLAVYMKDRLTVQRTSLWQAGTAGNETRAIQERFKAFLMNLTPSALEGTNASALADRFYNEYLQGQITAYVDKAHFIKETKELYAYASGGTVLQSDLMNMGAGATEDVYIIKLQRNVPQRIRMFIWLEGQDIDCVESFTASRFAVNIELAGGNE